MSRANGIVWVDDMDGVEEINFVPLDASAVSRRKHHQETIYKKQPAHITKPGRAIGKQAQQPKTLSVERSMSLRFMYLNYLKPLA